MLDLSRETEPGDAIKSVKEQLRAVPNKGIGHGLLRYMSSDPQIRSRLAAQSEPQVAFNYLGQFDQVLSDDSPFDIAPESGGESLGPESEMSHLIYLGGSITGGRLQMQFRYSQNIFESSTIETLANDMKSALLALIAHCQSDEAGGFTPSDFELAGLNQSSLDAVAELLAEADE